MERLAKVLARRGVASRRRCEDLIAAGRVRVNGRVVTRQGVRVDPDRDWIEVDGRRVRPISPVYILLNKPPGFVSTAMDPQGRPVVLDLVPIGQRFYPVGRLDINSEGLMLLTNDGRVTERLTHPRYEHEREYWVLVRGRPSVKDVARLRQGVELDDGLTSPASVSFLSARTVMRGLSWLEDAADDAAGTWLRIVIHEGRKRQVRRMCEAIGHPLVRLIRVRMGPLCLGDLAPGTWRRLTPDEVGKLREVLGIRPGGHEVDAET